jgi:hypothetical protein
MVHHLSLWSVGHRLRVCQPCALMERLSRNTVKRIARGCGNWNLTDALEQQRPVIRSPRRGPPVHSRRVSIGSLGPDKSNLLNCKGPINRLLSRYDCRLFAMRLASHDCAADECGPSPHVPPDAFDNRVFGSSIFHHIGRTCGRLISFPAPQNPGTSERAKAEGRAGSRPPGFSLNLC